MEEAETLRTLAEVSITIAGFTGIVVVFGNRAGGEWGQLEVEQLWLLLYQALTATVLAFVPILLHAADMEGQSIWRVSNATSAAAFSVVGARLLFRKGGLTAPEQASPFRAYSTAALSVAIVAAQLVHVAGRLPTRGSFLFLLALLYLVGLALLNFWLLLMSSVTGRSR